MTHRTLPVLTSGSPEGLVGVCETSTEPCEVTFLHLNGLIMNNRLKLNKITLNTERRLRTNSSDPEQRKLLKCDCSAPNSNDFPAKLLIK